MTKNTTKPADPAHSDPRLPELQKLVQQHWSTLPPDFKIARTIFGSLVDFIDQNMTFRPLPVDDGGDGLV